MPDFGLGRLVKPDPRDKAFALAPPRGASQIESRYWITRGRPYDQGSTPQCVAYAGNRWLVTNPVVNSPITPFDQLYRECQLVDEWPGEDYDGTSVRALFKVLKRQGLVEEYNWAWDAASIVDWVLSSGPMVVGTDWLNGMFYPDSGGLVKLTGGVAGGHAWTIIGASRKRGLVRGYNSWGEWGQGGRFWLRIEDLDILMRNGGEAATAKEKRL